MTCDCRKDIEARLLERLKSDHPEAVAHRASLGGFGFLMTGEEIGYVPTERSAEFKLKNGNGYKHRSIKGSMFFTFCPFCGVKYSKEAA